MTEQPRLLYLDDIPTPYRLGVHRLVAKRWPGRYKLAFLAAAEPGRDWDLDLSGLDVQVLPGRQFRPRRQINPFSFKWNPTVVRMLEAFRPDVVVLSGYVQPTIVRAARWCVTRDVPYAVVCETSCRSTTCQGWRWHLRRGALAWIVRKMAFGLPVGTEAADYLRRFGPTEAPMHAFPNTPDTSAISIEVNTVRQAYLDASVRAAFGIGEDADIVLFAGRFIDAKRPMDAVAAFERIEEHVRNAVLVMVGDGPLMPGLVDRAKGRNVVFTGWVRDPVSLARLMAISRLLVLPSRHEPWGAVVNEAMAAGLPVIASDRVTSAVELVDDGVNGYLFPVGDVDALSRCILACLSLNEVDRAQLSAAAQRTATLYGHEFAATNLIEGALAAVARKSGGSGAVAA